VVRQIEVRGRRPIKWMVSDSCRDTPERTKGTSGSDEAGEETDRVDVDRGPSQVKVAAKSVFATTSAVDDRPPQSVRLKVEHPTAASAVSTEDRRKTPKERRDRAAADVEGAARVVEALALADDVSPGTAHPAVAVPVAVRPTSMPNRRRKKSTPPIMVAVEDDELNDEARYVVEAVVTVDPPDRQGGGNGDEDAAAVAFLDFEGFGM
jgi:hypothetical protein